MITLGRADIRNLDRIAVERFGIPGVLLMENAGKGAAEALLSRLAPGPSTPVLVVAGRGNNGGDGFVVARHLTLAGFPVRVALAGSAPAFRTEGEAGVNFRIVERMGIPVVSLLEPPVLAEELDRAGIVVDALLGTGLEGEVRGDTRSIIEAIEERHPPVFAVDIPSGLDCDSGHPLGIAIHARATATFAAMKRGFLEEGAAEWTGPVDVIGLGAPIVWE